MKLETFAIGRLTIYAREVLKQEKLNVGKTFLYNYLQRQFLLRYYVRFVRMLMYTLVKTTLLAQVDDELDNKGCGKVRFIVRDE